MRRTLVVLVTLLAPATLVGVIAWRLPTDDAVSAISTPAEHMDYTGVPIGFNSEQASWAIPFVKMLACVRAVRYALRPTPVSFPSCARAPQVSLSDDTATIIVSGRGETDRPIAYVVTLQHNPQSLAEIGFLVTGVYISPTQKSQISKN